MRKTKIICTLGPKVKSEEKLRELILNGMDIARFNFSHMTLDDHREMFEIIKKLSKELDINVATMLDTKGPEVRLGNFKDSKVFLQNGATFILTTEDILGDEQRVSLSYKEIMRDIKLGVHFFIDDGLVELEVKSLTKTDVICKVIRGGFVSNKKGVNFPSLRLSLPFIDETDRADILFGINLGFDFIASSFTRTQLDVLELKDLLNKHQSNIKIIAKIENREGIDNIEGILEVADGVMVARGDMGVEIPFEELPIIQKQIINVANKLGKPSIVATQMLESMVGSPRPTRAESTDIANAVYDGASAVMLSAETAAGNYPIESLQVMGRIVSRADLDIYKLKKIEYKNANNYDRTLATAHAAVVMAEDLNAALILILTKTGAIARAIAEFNPSVDVIACAKDSTVCRQLNMLKGIKPVCVKNTEKVDQVILEEINSLKSKDILKDGDTIILVNGLNVSVSGGNAFLSPYTIGNQLLSGIGVNDLVGYGKVRICRSVQEVAGNLQPGEILVTDLNLNLLGDYIRIAGGIVTESYSEEEKLNQLVNSYKIPIIVGANDAIQNLDSGAFVKMDAGLCEIFAIDEC